MATAKTKYLSNLRTEMTHLQSGQKIITDAPTDNNGKGEAFSPTDLVASALGSCMVTIMGMAANTHSIDIEGAEWDITKIMSTSPRRIAEIVIDIYLPHEYTDKERKILENAAETCPVAKSLHPDLKQTITFHYNAK